MFSSALKSFSSNISSNYQISPNPSFISGPWKVHDGKKKSTGTSASVFIFDKKSLEQRSGGFGSRSSSSYVKSLHEGVLERLKREASSLARLRHPSILQILEPVEETRHGGLMFVTEPLTASLAGLLKEKDEQERAGGVGGRASRFVVESSDGSRTRRDFEIDELEIQKGLLQIGKGLEFLHESAGLVHGNLSPDAIYINAKSDWKISGLAFAGPADSQSTSSLPPLALSEVLYHEAQLPPSVQLNLDYTSPDFVLDSNVSTAADLFSLGLIIVALYNSPHTSPIQAHNAVNTYKKLLSSPSTIPTQTNSFQCSRPIPKSLQTEVLPRLITRRPAQRMSAREFQEAQYFDNILVSTIRFLESFPAKTPNEKSQFMRGLERVLPEFPSSVLEKKVLPALLEEAKDRELLPLVLQNVFKIIGKVTNGRRVVPDRVIPRLREIFAPVNNNGAAAERDTSKDAGLMVVLENMKLLADNCSGKEFKDDVWPLIHSGLESPTHSLVDMSLRCLPTLLPVLDFSTVKDEVFPPIALVFSKTSSLSIKVRGLEAFVILCGGTADTMGSTDDLSGFVNEPQSQNSSSSSILDKFTIQEKVMPLLVAIKTREPAVMMAALAVFRQIGDIVDMEFLALQVLPVMWMFSLGPLLNVQQFRLFMDLIKSLSTRIEKEHTKKLQELSSGNGEMPRNNTSSPFGLSTNMPSGGSGDQDLDFERLVLGKDGATKLENPMDSWGITPSPSSRPPISESGPKFSWSSTNAASATLSPRINSRSITPDAKASSFPVLQPMSGIRASTNQVPASTGLQSSFGGQPSLSQLSMNSTPLTPSVLSPSLQQMARPTPTMFTIPPPPSNFASSQPSFISPPPPSSFMPSNSSPMALPPPPQMNASHTSKNPPLQNALPPGPGSAQGRQGLDKYESLL